MVIKTFCKKKQDAKKLLDIKDEQPIEKTSEQPEQLEQLEQELEEEPEPIPVEKPKPKAKTQPKKVIKVVKRKRQPKPKKEIVYEDSDSESDDEEMLAKVYHTYKRELKQKKLSRSYIKKESPPQVEQEYKLPILKFV